MTAVEKMHWQPVCSVDDLVADSGVCALVEGEQVALFYLPGEEQQVYALQNRDPIGDANVLSRGMVGDVGGRLVVASPLYKQHFDLETGDCLEQEDVTSAIDGGCCSLVDVKGETKASTGCGGCAAMLKDLVEDRTAIDRIIQAGGYV